ncbi:MAG TPA: hypothetical protein VFN16_11310 [Saccharospirillum sp.]|nr:hypothetical protein [Saccharospirillum sp.]
MMTFKKLLPAFVVVPLALALPYAQAENPYLQADDTWISIDGEVHEVSPDSFVLDYGQGFVTVEMDDGDRDADAYSLLEGDEVTVSGIIDDGLYELNTIEASSVYVESIGTYFYASGVDEEDTFVTVDPVIISETVIQGTISSIGDEEFTLDTGAQEMTVQVDDMIYDPLDDVGYQQLDEGDFVTVTGNLDIEFFNDQVFEADTITTLM